MRGSARSCLYATEESVYSCASDASDHWGPDVRDKCVNNFLDGMLSHTWSLLIHHSRVISP